MTWNLSSKFLLCCIVFCTIQDVVYSEPASIVPQAGTMSTHEFETIRNYQSENKIKEDFHNFEKNKEHKKYDKVKKIKVIKESEAAASE